MCYYLNPLNFYTLFVFSVFFSASAKPEKIMSYDDMEPLPLIFDFTEEGIDDLWIVVNDNVMGGRSEGGYSFRQNHLIFSGNTNTNGGGFSSIRTNPTNFYLGDRTGLHIRFKGDGRTYKLGVRIEGKSVSYRSDFTSGNGWQEVRVPFNEMDVSWRGRPLSKEEHPLIKSKIRSIEFMIYDKQDGPFKLQVDWIKSY
jgi:hypothetical protein